MVFSIKHDLFLSILYQFLRTKSKHTTTERIYCNRNKSTDDLFAENATNQIYDTGQRSAPEMDYIRTSESFVGICLFTAVVGLQSGQGLNIKSLSAPPPPVFDFCCYLSLPCLLHGVYV